MSAKPRFHAAPATLFLAVILALAVTALVVLSGAEAARQGQPQCGDSITADTTLHHDLVDCPNNGIIIDADNITLDLNGHTIDGDGTPDAACNPQTDFCDFGVAFEARDGVTVRDGTVREFQGGILAFRTHDIQLLGISAPDNRFGDIGIARSARVLVKDSSGNGSTSREGNGLGLFDSDHIRVLDSSFRGNAHVGIKSIGSTNAVIKGSLMARNGDEGFLMEEAGKGFELRRNRFVDNGGGVTLGPGSENVIADNDVSGGSDGIRVEKGHGNLIANNVVLDTRRAGIRLGLAEPLIGGERNVVRENLVEDSRKDGFVVWKKDHHSLLERNVAKQAGDDGFDVHSPTTKLTKNRALHNADLGIEAARGTKDGGGNRAGGNGDPRQCRHIACN